MANKTTYLIPITDIRKSIKNTTDHSIFIIEVNEEDFSIEIFLEDILVEDSLKKIFEMTSGRGGKIETKFWKSTWQTNLNVL